MSGITINAELKDITIDNKENITISFNVKGINKYRFNDMSSKIQKLNDDAKNGLKLSIDKLRLKRTLTQNDSLWYLCEELAKELKSTKEEIYKEYIRKVGKFVIVPIREDGVDFWVKDWESRGIGFQCEKIRPSKMQGYKNIECYYGSSVYDTKEMSRVLEEVIKDCKEHNIDWMPYVDRQWLEEINKEG